MDTRCQRCDSPLDEPARTGLCPRCLENLGRAVWSDDASNRGYRRFADYEVAEEIGRGGMGVVYRARQPGLNRDVALKMVRDGRLTSRGAAERFRIEAETAAKLDHPNIVPIYEIGEEAGQLFYTMKLIEARPLLKERPVRETVVLMAKIARALNVAHLHGVLHRDLKPGNILVDGDDEPHVVDFGLAKVLGQDSGLTATSDMMGSPSYMAPEMVDGKNGYLTLAADIYGLGAVMYELLTGRPPFDGGTAMEVMRKVADEPPDHPSRFADGLGPDLETVCLKCLEKNSGDRYATAGEFADDLDRWLHGEPVVARPAGKSERLLRWCRRNPMLAAMTGLFLTALLVGTATSVAFWLREREQRLQTDDALYAADMLAVGHAMERHNFGRARQLIRRPAAEYESTGEKMPWELRMIKAQLADKSRATFADHESQVTGLGFLANEHLVSGSRDGRVIIRNVSTGNIVRSLQPTSSLVHLATIPGTSTFRFSDKERLSVRAFDGESGEPLWELPAEMNRIRQGRVMAVFADGDRILYTGVKSELLLGRIDHSEPPVKVSGSLRVQSGIALSPNEKVLAVFSAGTGGAVSLHSAKESEGRWDSDWRSIPGFPEINSTAPLDQASLSGGNPDLDSVDHHRLVFSPDSSKLAAAYGRNICLVDVAQTKLEHNFTLHPAGHHVETIAFSPDGRWLASGGTDQMVRIIDLDNWKQVVELAGHDDAIRWIAFDMAGETMATGSMDGEVKLWDVATAIASKKTPFQVPELPLITKERFRPKSEQFLTIEKQDGQTMVRLRALTSKQSLCTLDLGELRVADALQLDDERIALYVCEPRERPPIFPWIEVRDLKGALLSKSPPFEDPMPMGPNFDYRAMSRIEGTNHLVVIAGSSGSLPWGKELHPITLHHFDVETGNRVRPPDKVMLGIGLSGGVFNHRGNLHVFGGHDGDIVVVDIENGNFVKKLPERHFSFVSQVSFSADDSLLASVSMRRVLIWDTATWRKIGEVPALDQDLRSAALHPNEPRVAVGGVALKVAIWDWRKARQVGTLTPVPLDGDNLFKLQYCGEDGDTLSGWVRKRHDQAWLNDQSQVVLWNPGDRGE